MWFTFLAQPNATMLVCLGRRGMAQKLSKRSDKDGLVSLQTPYSRDKNADIPYSQIQKQIELG